MHFYSKLLNEIQWMQVLGNHSNIFVLIHGSIWDGGGGYKAPSIRYSIFDNLTFSR